MSEYVAWVFWFNFIWAIVANAGLCVSLAALVALVYRMTRPGYKGSHEGMIESLLISGLAIAIAVCGITLGVCLSRAGKAMVAPGEVAKEVQIMGSKREAP